MRIAALHYSLPPVTGGVERVIRDQAAALRKLGHEVTLLDRRGAGGLFSSSGAACFHAVLVHNVMTMPFDLEWTRELHDLAVRHPEVRWVNWIHDVCAINPAYAHVRWQEPVPPMLHVAVSGVRRADYAAATGLPLDKIQVIPNGIDLARVLGLTVRVAALPLVDWDLVLVHPTRLVRRKNIELGLRIVAALAGAGCDALYLVTGASDPHQADGLAYLAELKELRATLGIEDRVRFLGEAGALDEEDVRSLYAVSTRCCSRASGRALGCRFWKPSHTGLPFFAPTCPCIVRCWGVAWAVISRLKTSLAKSRHRSCVGWMSTNPGAPERFSGRSMTWSESARNILSHCCLPLTNPPSHDRSCHPDRRDSCTPRSAPRRSFWLSGQACSAR